MMEKEHSTDKRLTYGFRLCVTRPPQSQELVKLRKTYEKVSAYLTMHPEKAKEIASQHKPQMASDLEFASWVMVANALINLDEAIMRR